MTERTILDPDLPIIDAHHHLLDRPPQVIVEHLNRSRFLIDEYEAETAGGHNVVATVVVEARAAYRASGPASLRPVGETEFLNGQAAMAASGAYGRTLLSAGIVAWADLRLGDAVRDVLEAHLAAAPQRMKGIRFEGVWDADPTVLGSLFDIGPQVYADPDFRRGFAHLAPLGLTFDAFVLGPQIGDVIDLARAFPDTTIILDHMATPIGRGARAGRREADYPAWLAGIKAVAQLPNVVVKLGGLGTYISGFPSFRAETPATHEMLADEWRIYVEPVVEHFGARRCMWESNLPTDGSGTFATVCNAYKLMTAGCSADERRAIFAGTAARIYTLDI